MVSNFVISYTDILGNIRNFSYEMNKAREGTLLFSPARLTHQVFPFYHCGDERVSISGNIGVSSQPTNQSN